MDDVQAEPSVYEGPVTVAWLRQQALLLLHEARKGPAKDRDHGVCFRYLEFLLKLGTEGKASKSEGGSADEAPGQAAARSVWEVESHARNIAIGKR